MHFGVRATHGDLLRREGQASGRAREELLHDACVCLCSRLLIGRGGGGTLGRAQPLVRAGLFYPIERGWPLTA